MKRYVYVLSTTGEDHQAEMAAISMHTLKMTNPDAEIVVVFDKQTERLASPGMTEICELADRRVAVEAKYDGQVVRSRYIKVNLRSILEDSFVYLDTDTLILNKLDGIWQADTDMAVCRDFNISPRKYVYNDTLKSVYELMGWRFPPAGYYNGGVVFYNETSSALEFGRKLAGLWESQLLKTGKPNDQFAFNCLLDTNDYAFKVLSDKYNAQIVMSPLLARGACVAHIYSDHFDDRDDTVLHVAAKTLKKEKYVNKDILRGMIDRSNPWHRLDTVKKCLSVGKYGKALTLAVSRMGGHA